MMRKSCACSICGCRIRRRDNAGNETTPLCLSCYQRHYTYCIRCGIPLCSSEALYSQDDLDCAPADSNRFISLTPEQVKKYEEQFHIPEMFWGMDGRIVCLPLEVD